MAYSKFRKSNRVGFIDEYRGFFVVAMVIYHALYNLVYIFGVNLPFFDSGLMNITQRVIVSSFIVISGASSRYSGNNIKRGLMVFAIACLMTAFTVYFMPSQAIYFGVLHFLGLAMILFGLLRKVLDFFPCFWGLCLMVLLTLLTWGVPFAGSVGLFGWFGVTLPAALYSSPYLFWLGFPHPGFFSADYVPVIPWIFMFFAGGYLGVFFQQGYMPAALYRTRFRALAAIGRKALVIYLLHQPILYGLMWLWFEFI